MTTAEITTTEPVITDEIREAAHAMYVQACGAGQANERPQDINELAWLMTRRTVTGMSEAKLNSPQYQALRADKNNVYMCSVARYSVFAHCVPVAAVPAAPAAQPAQDKS